MRPARWTGSWTIRAPRERVFEVMTDFENWPKLFPGMVKTIRVVSRTDKVAVLEGDFELLGRKGRGVMRVTLDPPRGYATENSSAELGEEKRRSHSRRCPVARSTDGRWRLSPTVFSTTCSE